MKNSLYLKLKNLKKPDFLLLEYLLERNKVSWLVTDKQLLEKAKEKRE
jgi:hypothetical protein